MTLSVPGGKSAKGDKPGSRENKQGERDDSPNLSADQMSNDFSSACCGYEFPENNLGQMVSSANLMFSQVETISVGSHQPDMDQAFKANC
jgi:hypothetical protein